MWVGLDPDDPAKQDNAQLARILDSSCNRGNLHPLRTLIFQSPGSVSSESQYLFKY